MNNYGLALNFPGMFKRGSLSPFVITNEKDQKGKLGMFWMSKKTLVLIAFVTFKFTELKFCNNVFSVMGSNCF